MPNTPSKQSLTQDRPRLLVVSHVLPFPGISGQQQRVANSLLAFRDRFEVTFVTTAPRHQHPELQRRLSEFCHHPLILSSPYHGTPLEKVRHRIGARLMPLFTGLKASNHIIGSVEFPPSRLSEILEDQTYDLALFEYFHAHHTARALKERGIPTVLDTHNVLWQAYERQCRDRTWIPTPLQRWAVNRYRRAEETAWNDFNALIAINTAEADYIRSRIPASTQLVTACMGLDLDRWPAQGSPATPPRIGYYGGLGSSHNAKSALSCFHDVMPGIWKSAPETEFWIVGSNPPPEILALQSDHRVKVTGFVEQPQQVLGTLTAVLCPWSGTYGFRSRLVEVMALGVPVIASKDAAYGMEFTHGQGIALVDTPEQMTAIALQWMNDAAEAKRQREAARRSVESHYGFDATYGKLCRELIAMCHPTPQLSTAP